MSRRDDIEARIRRNNRSISDPYEQDKWIQREDNERLERELGDVIRSGRRFSEHPTYCQCMWCGADDRSNR